MLVTFEKVSTDAFWNAIKDVELTLGRRARDIIHPAGGHETHFHWDRVPIPEQLEPLPWWRSDGRMFARRLSAGAVAQWLMAMVWRSRRARLRRDRRQRLRSLAPVDQASVDPSFELFRREFIAALNARDRKFVEGIVDPEILVSFGPDSGARAFLDRWHLTNPADPFWQTMLATVSLGGEFVSPQQFCAPYVYTAFPDDLDAADHFVVIVREAPLRSAPDATAGIVRVLSYNIVKRAESGGGAPKAGSTPPWVRVIAGNGPPGYVSSSDVRSPVDYRACFDRKGSGWKLTAFLQGE